MAYLYEQNKIEMELTIRLFRKVSNGIDNGKFWNEKSLNLLILNIHEKKRVQKLDRTSINNTPVR